ncbi:MAG TPA: amidohydrolase family protein [Thermoleophilia bacterium]
MKRIDFENHFSSEAWVDAMLANTEGYPRLVREPSGTLRMFYMPDAGIPFPEPLRDLGDGRIEAMDEAGVDTAVLSLTAPGAEPFESTVGTRVAKTTNDVLAEAVDKHPDRFKGFASLCPRDTDAAVKELERCVKELGFVGWNTHSNFGDSYLDEKRFWPLLGKAEELNVPIFIHPTVSLIPQFRTYGIGLAGASFGFGAETAMVMMRLIISGAFDAFPNLKIILGHYGEGLPFMVDRVSRPYHHGHRLADPAIAPELRTSPDECLKRNLFVDTSGNHSAVVFSGAKSVLGIEKMVLGTDYPYESMKACVEFLETQPMTASEKEQLYGGTASSLGVVA